MYIAGLHAYPAEIEKILLGFEPVERSP